MEEERENGDIGVERGCGGGQESGVQVGVER